jgi:drug/metabolite transporter (DMT)-like permease
MKQYRHANFCALGAIALWSMLAVLGVKLSHVPPFLLTGLALLVGSALAWPFVVRQPGLWRVPVEAVALGVYGLFGFHLLLFIALRQAPPVQANLLNYLWPLLMVVLAPLLLPAVRLRPAHVLAAIVGFLGAALAIAGGAPHGGGAASAAAPVPPANVGAVFWGYMAALGSALVWATYSLGTRRLADEGAQVPTSAIGLFGAVSGLLALACHAMFEPPVTLGLRDGALIVITGLGPLGVAFYLWDRALKLGDPRTIGVLSYLTPLASTLLLVLATGRGFSGGLLLSAVLISGAAMLALRTGPERSSGRPALQDAVVPPDGRPV